MPLLLHFASGRAAVPRRVGRGGPGRPRQAGVHAEGGDFLTPPPTKGNIWQSRDLGVDEVEPDIYF